MSYFTNLPIEIKQQLISYFENKPVGTKLKYHLKIKFNDNFIYHLENSYIKLEKDIYALGKGNGSVLGEGAFGKVKYARSLLTNKVFAIKVIPFSTSENTDILENELKILYDLGLYQDGGVRSVDIGNKQYIVMLDAGVSLNDYLRVHPILGINNRLDLAIKLCWLVYCLHEGLSSRQLIPYAHRDLKPANVALSSSGRMRLIDVGLANKNIDSAPEEYAGAPIYLPNLATFLNNEITLRKLDVLALKRIIHMPNKVFCFLGYKEDVRGQAFDMRMLLSDRILNSLKIFNSFDTSANDLNHPIVHASQLEESPLTLASLLVLARYNLLEQHGEKMRDPILASAVLGLYFNRDDKNDVMMQMRLASALIAYQLAPIAPSYQELANQIRLIACLVSVGISVHLNDALKNKTLITLITSQNPKIAHAAALLWQNNFQDEELLAQLKSVDVANEVIKRIFDGNLMEVKTLLTKPILAPIKQNYTANQKAHLYKFKPSPNYKKESNEDKELVSQKNQHAAKSGVRLPPLFFSKQGVRKTTKASVSHYSPLMH